MDSVAGDNGFGEMFDSVEEVARYARHRGRRELEVALSSGWLGPRSAGLVALWLRQDDLRRQRWWWIPAWSGFGLAALVVALFF